MRILLRRCGVLVVRTCNLTLVIGVVAALFIALLLGGVLTWEYTNSSEFCASACHEVHPEETVAYSDSYHAKVKCVECHMGRLPVLKAALVKATHMSHLWSMITGDYERPMESHSMRPATHSCERCHWPEAFHDDRLRVINRYETDEKSTKISTRLVLHTGGGSARREGGARGIHWHVENELRYIATDAQKLNIPWLEVTHGDGSTTTYTDVTNPLSPKEIASGEKRVMDCMDCHNRVGHPFEVPEEAVDLAINFGHIDSELPYAKAWAMRLLSYDYATREQADKLAEATREAYRQDYPMFFATHREAVARSEKVMKELLYRIKFRHPEISWRSFPDHSSHKNFPGCFRCHDGKHFSAEGDSVRLHCNICHDVPVVLREGESPQFSPRLSLSQPSNHLSANFIHEHRFLANDGCARCHIDVEFGTDNRSFCANSACHGKQWPAVQLDATKPHPVALEGQHAGVWCHQCHKGVKRPNADCETCHESPASHEFSMACERCHFPVGWSNLQGVEKTDAPALPHPELTPATCRGCHDADAGTSYLDRHEGFVNESCTMCHELVAPPAVPHVLKGREKCLACHAVQSNVHPMPPDHKDRLESRCVLCHAL